LAGKSSIKGARTHVSAGGRGIYYSRGEEKDPRRGGKSNILSQKRMFVLEEIKCLNAKNSVQDLKTRGEEFCRSMQGRKRYLPVSRFRKFFRRREKMDRRWLRGERGQCPEAFRDGKSEEGETESKERKKDLDT